MMKIDWAGVYPAMTTPFKVDLSVDLDEVKSHASWLLREGCRGLVALGSLGEGQTLTFDEKVEILKACKKSSAGKGPLVAGISALSTAEAVALAKAAAEVGTDALMVLPAYVYQGDRRETEAHFSAVISATTLPCMLYNNPIAYGVDVRPEGLKGLADRHENLVAVKESSGDIRRVTSIREVLGDRLRILVGMDDSIVEGVSAGAVGWVAGLVNALPRESVELFELAAAGRREEARRLYEWFLPLLRLDTVPKFVQLVKLVQEAVGRGGTRVRPPRLELEGAELNEARAVIHKQLGGRARL